MRCLFMLIVLLLLPACSLWQHASTVREEGAWEKELRSTLRSMEQNGDDKIPVYFLERDDCEYGGYDGKPRRVGTMTARDLEGLLAQERISLPSETQDYWYAIKLGIPRQYPAIDFSFTPCEKLGFKIAYQEKSVSVRDRRLHAKMKRMLGKRVQD